MGEELRADDEQI